LTKKQSSKVIRHLICIILFTIVTAGCAADSEQDNFDYGRVEDGIYFNNYFNFTIDLPAGWVVQSQEQTQKIADMGKNLVAGDDEKLKAAIEATEVNTANLLAVFQYELGAAVQYNPNFMIVAENIKNSPGVKNGSDYLFHSKKLLSQGQFKYDYLSENFENEKISGKEFYKMDAQLNYMGLEIKQVFYSTVLKGFSFNIIVSYVSDEQKEVLTEAINTMSFTE
jgi:hypothetical protein